jgi:hypothetical protein
MVIRCTDSPLSGGAHLRSSTDPRQHVIRAVSARYLQRQQMIHWQSIKMSKKIESAIFLFLIFVASSWRPWRRDLQGTRAGRQFSEPERQGEPTAARSWRRCCRGFVGPTHDPEGHPELGRRPGPL